MKLFLTIFLGVFLTWLGCKLPSLRKNLSLDGNYDFVLWAFRLLCFLIGIPLLVLAVIILTGLVLLMLGIIDMPGV
jgi:hypothetical protein